MFVSKIKNFYEKQIHVDSSNIQRFLGRTWKSICDHPHKVSAFSITALMLGMLIYNRLTDFKVSPESEEVTTILDPAFVKLREESYHVLSESNQSLDKMRRIFEPVFAIPQEKLGGLCHFKRSLADSYFYNIANREGFPPISMDMDHRCSTILYLRPPELGNPIVALPAHKLLERGSVRSFAINEVSNVCEAIEYVASEGGEIDGILIAGHGNPHGLSLTDNASLEDYNNSSLANRVINIHTQFPEIGCLNLLQPNAPIGLLSCSTGAINPHGEENLADAISKQAPGHKVYAPTFSLLRDDFVVRSRKELEFRFFDSDNDQIEGTYVAHKKI